MSRWQRRRRYRRKRSLERFRCQLEEVARRIADGLVAMLQPLPFDHDVRVTRDADGSLSTTFKMPVLVRFAPHEGKE